jgi:outer membrane protein
LIAVIRPWRLFLKCNPITRASALVASVLASFPGIAVAQGAPDPPTVNNPQMSLQDALRVAALDNVTLKQMRADADAASAEARGAQAQTKPSLSTTTYGTVGDSPNILTTSPGVTPQNIFSVAPRGFADQNLMLMVPLYTGGRLGRAAASARKQGEVAGLTVQAAGLSVTEQVTEDYTNAALQQALVDAAQARLTAEDEQVRVTQEKVNTGRSAPVDLLREQAEQADAKQALQAAQNNAALALVDLRAAMGVSQESNIGLSETLDGLAAPGGTLPAPLQDALRQAEAHRPELAAAQKLVEAAQSGVSAARGEYAPQVYGVAMGDATAGQGIGRAGYTVGLTASLPLYDAGQRRADVDGASARLDRSRADALQARQQVDQQVATAWLTLQTATAQVQDAATGVTAAQEGYDLAALRYNAGKSVTAERLDALSALTRAQGTLAQAKAGLVNARAALQAALGVI